MKTSSAPATSAGTEEEADIVRVVYASRARLDGPASQAMEDIRRSALRHNRPLGIHTALLWQSHWFVQWKEGPRAPLRDLMARVCRDPRHEGLTIVHASQGPRLLDGPWSMAIADAKEPQEAIAGRITALRRAVEAGERFEPQDVWRCLSMPGRHEPAAPAGGEQYQRFLVACTLGTTAFAFVRWLAACRRGRVEHRRFAGLDLDVATELVDFRCGALALPAVGMARKGLKLPLTRALLRGYSHLALLLCPDEARNLALLQRVGEACARLPEPPAVVGVGADPRGHAALHAAAAPLGLAYLAALADPRDCAGTWRALRPLIAGAQ
ncbi:BLUF domain-containing protein [Ramlibacter rhizophilus]|nr:BLUF domain-containing protein [Ramlibacter rhizophilus]